MTYRTIVLELRDEPAGEARLATALGLARRFGAELVGVHAASLPLVTTAPSVGLGVGAGYVDAELIEAQRAANRAVQDRVRAAFQRFAAAEAPDVQVRVLLVEDLFGVAFSDAARTADLAILGPAADDGDAATPPPPQPVEDVLVQAGGPVLVLPRDAGAARLPAARALVAWNGSRQAARALKDAAPLLALAEETVVLTLGEAASEASLGAAADLLRRHGIAARPQRRAEEGSAGGQILAAAAELGAGLVVMGAYSHSRLREAVFGGATSEVLAEARVPVLFAH